MADNGEPADDRARLAELERRLEDSARRLEETQALARVGSWEWELPMLRATWSKEMLRIFGRDPDGPPPEIDELIAAVHPDDRAGFRELVATVKQTPGPFRYSYRIIDADGEMHHLQARGRTVADEEGRPIRSYGTTQDISELKRSEAQLERAKRLEAVGQLAGGVAHDFNNLLAVILNQTECLIEDADPGNEQTLSGLGEIERAALTAADLTRHLLLFSRRETTDLQPVDLIAALGESEPLLRSAIGERVKLEVEAPAELPPVRLGVGQVDQLLVNLAVNARDAMPEGGRLAIAVREVEAGAPEADPGPAPQSGAAHLVLSVADDGIGMSAETAAQAFDPFFTTKPRDKGTGLGLATVYGIVSQAGGQIEIDSAPGEGTVVTVHLPVLADGEVAPAPAPPLPQPGQGQTVLVVDNEEAVRTIVCRMLERHGYRTVAADGGDEAEAILAGGGNVDLLLTDIIMPGMSGWELVGRLHAKNPGMRALYMSGYVAGGGSVGRPLGEGAIILEKPFTGTQLIAAVGELLTRDRHGSAS